MFRYGGSPLTPTYVWVCFVVVPVCAQHESMVSASVEVIGAVCRRLTWSKYLYYLKHFIHILQTGQAEQKLAVRYTRVCVCQREKACVCQIHGLFHPNILSSCSLLEIGRAHV